MTRRFLLILLVDLASLAAAEADYLFGFIRSAPGAQALSAEERKTLQAAHMTHIGSMAEAGALVAAGPVIGSPNLRGIFLFKATANARELSNADPLVKAGQLMVELHSWRGPAGIGERYFAEHKKNPGAPTKMIHVQLVVLKRAENLEKTLARLQASGQVMAAGMLSGSGDLGAVCVLNAGNVEAARALAGGASSEVHDWMVAEGVLPQ
jgi:uncharacterized protein YciI